MKKVSLLLMAVATIAMSASATKIYVCGTKITGTTSFNTSGGTVSYNDNTRTLNITDVDYTKSGSSNNGISVDEVSGNLTINLYGTVKFTINDADAVLCKCKLNNGTTLTTYINVNGNAEFTTKSNSHAALKLQDGDVYVYGSGTLNLKHTSSGSGSGDSHAVKGGAGTEKLTLAIKNCTLESYKAKLYNLNKVTINPTGSYGSDDYTTKVTFKKSNAVHASSISNWGQGAAIKIFKPFDYYGYSINTIANSSLSSSEVVISDIAPVAIIHSSYFPDANFRSYLLNNGYGKGYITNYDVSVRTSFYMSNYSISNLEGIQYFTQLTSLDCSNNNLTSLNVTALTKLKTLNCSNNNLTTFGGTLPASLKTLNCSYNKFSGPIYITDHSALEELNISYCSSLNYLYCYNNALTVLNYTACSALTYVDCHNNNLDMLYTLPESLQSLNCSYNKFRNNYYLRGNLSLKSLNFSYNTLLKELYCDQNALTSLNVTGCSTMTVLDCSNNQLTSLSDLPTTLKTLRCYNNKLSGTFTLTGRSSLVTLSISNNPNLTGLKCYNNSLESLNLSGCSALTYLDCSGNHIYSLSNLPASLKTIDCSSNQLSDLPTLPNNIEVLRCASNKFGTLTIAGMSKLKTLDVSSNTLLTTLNCYNNALTTLSYSGCSTLKNLDCAVNKLASLPALPSSVTKFNCSANQLTSLPSLSTGLVELSCAYNKLTSLSVQGLNSLNKLEIYGNQIKETAMGTLVNSLRTIPAGSTGDFKVLGSTDEGNVITTAQVKTARNKRWIPKKSVNGSWVEIPVSGSVPGDVDGDGIVTSVDITILYNYLLNGTTQGMVNGDQDGDGIITSVDITIIYNILLGNN